MHILKLIRKKEKPLEQIVMRMEEIEKYNSDLKIELSLESVYPIFLNESSSNNKTVKFKNFVLKTNLPNNCCGLTDGSVVIIKDFRQNNAGLFLIGNKFKNLRNFYDNPCLSSEFCIYSVEDEDMYTDVEEWNVKNVILKYIKIPFEHNTSVVFPLLHC